MPRYLWLVRLQYFYKKADANLIISNEIDEAQTGRICKGLEQQFHVVVLVTHRYDQVGSSDRIYDPNGLSVPFWYQPAPAFQKNGVTPNAVESANALANTDFSKTTTHVKTQTCNVLRKHACLQSPQSVLF